MYKLRLTAILPAILLSLSLSLFSSCELETSDNGDLDGMWHLMQVDTISTGGINDVVPQRIYWSFQVRLANLRSLVDGPDVFCRFERNENLLRLHSFYFNDRPGGDPALDEATAVVLKKVMVDSLTQTYRIDNLDASTMVLSTNTLKLRFVKY